MPHSDKKIVSFFSHIKNTTMVIIVTSLLVAIAATVGFINDGLLLYENFKKNNWLVTSIEGRFLTSGAVVSGELITFSYTLPDFGYYSLWNQNNAGKMIRLIPKAAQRVSQQIHPKKGAYHFNVRGNKAMALEHMVILWSDTPNHPPQKYYPQWNAFDEYIKTHTADWQIKKVAVQIL